MTAGPGSPQRSLRPVFAGLMLAMLLAALDHTIVATALPTIVGELGDLAALPWVVTAYMLAATVSVPVIGRLSDQLGRTRVFQAAIGLFVLGALASGTALSLPWLVAARVVQGAGAGGVIALTQTTIADLVSARDRGRYHGLLGAVFGVASIAGPLLGGLFVDHLSWRLAFWLNVPLGLLAMAVIGRLLRLSPTGGRRRVDWVGATLLTAGVAGLLLVIASAGRDGGLTPGLAGLAAAIVALLALFLLSQRRADEPIVPLGLFRNRVFALGSALGFVVGVGMFGTLIYTPLYLQAVLGASATASGFLLLPLLGGLIAATVVSGRLVTRWGRYKPFPVAGTFLLALGVWLLSGLGADTTRLEAALPR
jgi:EmrB/QacA subfamily drug resistance transporter